MPITVAQDAYANTQTPGSESDAALTGKLTRDDGADADKAYHARREQERKLQLSEKRRALPNMKIWWPF
ncbi:MAG: hypothetical protein Q9M30_11000 [Mariprofundaceae bacterium]|nr:hypothetical protein [Mariprofundaceae bacterium]